MPDNINFVRERRRKFTKLEQQDRVWLRWSMMAAGGVMVVTLAALGGRFALQWQVQQTKAEQDRLKREVSSQQEVERSYVIFANKLRMLKEIVDGRADKQAAIALFTRVFGPQVLLKEITFEADSKLLSFHAQAPDIFELERVVALLDSTEIKNTYPNLERSELRRTSEGNYNVGITITLGEDKPAAKP